MTWQTISASETDANSPLNQTLMDKIRGNLDYLHGGGAQLAHIHGSNSNSGDSDPLTVTVSSSAERDWRDRYLQVKGIIMSGSYSAVPPAYVPGGSKDAGLHSQRAAHKPTDIAGWNGGARFDEWMYSAGGSSSYNAEPYLVATSKEGTAIVEAYFWVDTSGNLKFTVDFNATSGYRAVAYNFMIIYSEDQGGH